MKTEQITTTTIRPSAGIKTPYPYDSSFSTIRSIKSETSDGGRATRSEVVASSTETHRSEAKSEQKFHMTLEHKPAPYDPSAPKEIQEEQQRMQDSNENVDSSRVARKDALNFFEQMSRVTDTSSLPKGPKDMIKLIDDDDGTGPGADIKVGRITQNFERNTKFDEVHYEKPKTDSSKKAVQDIFNKFEKGESSRGIDNTLLFDFPYEQYKLPQLNTTRTVFEDLTASGSPIHGSLTISKLEAQSQSAEAMMKGFNLVPEPPPEIGYAPKPPEEKPKKRYEGVSQKAKQLQETIDKNCNPLDAPVGGVKIFPTSPVPKPGGTKATPKTPASTPTKPLSIPPPFELGSQKTEWTVPGSNIKICSSETRQDLELKPEDRCTKTTIESSTSLETKAWGSKEVNIEEKNPEPEPQPIIYNAETIKVDHSVKTIEEKSVIEKYTSECDVKKMETLEKKVETVQKQSAPRPWPDDEHADVAEDLKSPKLVKQFQHKPAMVGFYRAQGTPEPILEPGPPPEMGYAPGPTIRKGSRIEQFERTLERSMEHKPAKLPPGAIRTIPPPPLQTKKKEVKSTFHSESEYESDCPGYRRVQAPTNYHPRPRSTEPEPLPPSKFEVPPPSLTGPARPQVTASNLDLGDRFSNTSTTTRQYQTIDQLRAHGGLPQPAPAGIYSKTYPKPESPKFKPRNLKQESGYMADTDEPFQHLQQQQQAGSAFSETRSSYMESKSYSSSGSQNKDYMSSYSQSQSYSNAPSQVQRSSYIEEKTTQQPRYRPVSMKVRIDVNL